MCVAYRSMPYIFIVSRLSRLTPRTCNKLPVGCVLESCDGAVAASKVVQASGASAELPETKPGGGVLPTN